MPKSKSEFSQFCKFRTVCAFCKQSHLYDTKNDDLLFLGGFKPRLSGFQTMITFVFVILKVPCICSEGSLVVSYKGVPYLKILVI